MQKRARERGDVTVIGYDSETMHGPPITHQFHCPELQPESDCIFIGKRQPTAVFLRYLDSLPPGAYRMYGHNLEFDMLSALWNVRAKIRDGDIDLHIGGWEISGRYSKPIFARFSDGERSIELVDSFLWFMSSLERAAEKVCPWLPKLKRPRGLGTTLYNAKDTAFVEYALRDAVVAYHLGVAIERFHAELGIPSQISLASMAQAVFRMKYMQANIYQPPMYQWMVGAAASYHGGVNRVRAGAAPAWHMNVTALDVSSAYPHAMNEFPAFDDPNGYKRFKGAASVRKVPAHGVYKITGRAAPCDWPALFDHDFKPLTGRVAPTWVTGFELNEALACGELELESISGYHYHGKTRAYSPFAAYVQDFYRLKSEADDAVMRYMYKIVLNALTGKFIQTSPDYTLVDGQLCKIQRAGGLYHPFIASLITGHTRAAIHRLEHKHNALHTATDGIFVPGNVAADHTKSLGAVVQEGCGDLALFRNKLYIFYTDEQREGAYPSQAFADRFILKCARHGFQGTVGELEKMLVSPERSYTVNKPIKLKTALRTGQDPNKFINMPRTLRVDEAFKVVRHV